MSQSVAQELNANNDFGRWPFGRIKSQKNRMESITELAQCNRRSPTRDPIRGTIRATEQTIVQRFSFALKARKSRTRERSEMSASTTPICVEVLFRSSQISPANKTQTNVIQPRSHSSMPNSLFTNDLPATVGTA